MFVSPPEARVSLNGCGSLLLIADGREARLRTPAAPTSPNPVYPAPILPTSGPPLRGAGRCASAPHLRRARIPSLAAQHQIGARVPESGCIWCGTPVVARSGLIQLTDYKRYLDWHGHCFKRVQSHQPLLPSLNKRSDYIMRAMIGNPAARAFVATTPHLVLSPLRGRAVALWRLSARSARVSDHDASAHLRNPVHLCASRKQDRSTNRRLSTSTSLSSSAKPLTTEVSARHSSCNRRNLGYQRLGLT